MSNVRVTCSSVGYGQTRTRKAAATSSKLGEFSNATRATSASHANCSSAQYASIREASRRGTHGGSSRRTRVTICVRRSCAACAAKVRLRRTRRRSTFRRRCSLTATRRQRRLAGLSRDGCRALNCNLHAKEKPFKQKKTLPTTLKP